jgi:hypothetical protein
MLDESLGNTTFPIRGTPFFILLVVFIQTTSKFRLENRSINASIRKVDSFVVNSVARWLLKFS